MRSIRSARLTFLWAILQVIGILGSTEPMNCERNGAVGWCQVPRLGEAKKPGPPTNLDSADDDLFDEGDCECMPAPGEMDWMPDTDDEEFEVPLQQHVHEMTADCSEVEKWLTKNASLAFVAVPNKTVTKKSKFEGPRPGWVFKFGDEGLGYYRDYGGMVVQVALEKEIPLATKLPAARIPLSELLPEPTPAPERVARASCPMFTPAGVAATCAAILAAGAPTAAAAADASDQSVRHRITDWDRRLAAGELRPAIPKNTQEMDDGSVHDLPAWGGATQHARENNHGYC